MMEMDHGLYMGSGEPVEDQGFKRFKEDRSSLSSEVYERGRVVK